MSREYGRRYRTARDLLLEDGPICAHCRVRPATEADHMPPISQHRHETGSGCCVLVPSCRPCNRESWRKTAGLSTAAAKSEEPERSGLDRNDSRWRVPWLEALLDVPPDAVWPRLMSVPHRRATGSLGPVFIDWAEARSGFPLRWWQRLAATRLLETDDSGRLVWELAVLSMSRQLGKSWLLRELSLWRIHQGDRFGEPQVVMYTGRDLSICKEVQRPARAWAKTLPDVFKVREVNGQEELELLEDGSRYMLRAKNATFGYSVSLGVLDEAWAVRASAVDDALAPTMAEREQPQLVLVSTAHRLATSLMLARRAFALDSLETGDGDLLIEWSAPAGARLDDLDGWQQASPHWSLHRQRLIERQLAAARDGTIDDPEEPDPVESFKAQWLNIWPRKLAEPQGTVEELLPAGLWDELAEPGVVSAGPVYVAIEDNHGIGAAVAAACRLDDGRLELDGWLLPDWDSAVSDVRALGLWREVRQLRVGASLLDRCPPGMTPAPAPAGAKETRPGLALFRDLALNRQLVHDETPDLDTAVRLAQVKTGPAGLALAPRGPQHLVKAACWALQAAHRPAAVPAIY